VASVRPNSKFRGNVFISNLPPGFTRAQLADTFERFGIVIDVLLARDPETGASRRCALLNLAPQKAAEQAVDALDGAQIDGKKIRVSLAAPDMAITVSTRTRHRDAVRLSTHRTAERSLLRRRPLSV
jgi:RNA recognition motif-containing protein